MLKVEFQVTKKKKFVRDKKNHDFLLKLPHNPTISLKSWGVKVL